MTALDALRALVEAAQYQRRHPESFFAQEDLNSAAYALLDADPDGTLLDKLAADARDGEALRLLREALPDEPAYPDNLSVVVVDDPHETHELRLVTVRVIDGWDDTVVECVGDTIAEAADEARAELEGQE